MNNKNVNFPSHFCLESTSLFSICSESCNSVDDLPTKICVPSKTKDINVKVINMITNKNKAKAMVKHVSCDCKCRFNSTT